MLRVNLMIGDREASAADGRTFERLDPVSGEVATTAAAATIADVIAAGEAAAAAFPAWAALGPSERGARLVEAADTLLARIEDFAEAMIAETGATPAWCEFNVRQAAAILRDAAATATQATSETLPGEQSGQMMLTMRQPVGVVLGIASWTAPVLLGVRAIALPLACGNTVILKASELCPATHRMIGTALRDAGLGNGVVNVVTHAPGDAGKVVETLIAHPAVRRITYSGPTQAGRLIGETAARYLKPVLLELGGKASLIVLDDADLEAAADAAAAVFVSRGQAGAAGDRIVVDEAVADAFRDKLATRAQAFAAEEDPASGALIDHDAVTQIRALIDDAVGRGAMLATGGGMADATLAPTILDRVTPAMRVYHEEVFGPVATLVRVKDAEQAIEVANDTDNGPAAAVFGRDVGRALQVAARLRSGVCHINAAGDDAQMPFGGAKAAGRFGRAALDHVTTLRWITVTTAPQPHRM